jgi:DNA-binding response OmpR family regulator
MSLGRVLVVDDEPEIAEMICDVLVGFGYVVEIAHNGADAMGLMAQFRPEAVLLDVLMPGMTGADVLAWLRQEHPGVSVVMVTGQTDEDKARALLTGGAFDYVRKPFDVHTLERVVEAAVGSAVTAAG